MLPADFARTLRTDAGLDGFGHRELATTAATPAFVVDFNLFRQSRVIAVRPNPAESLSGGSVRADMGFLPVHEGFTIENRAQKTVGILIVRTVQEADEVRGVVIGLTDPKSEPCPGLAGSDSKGRVTGQSEFANLNHGYKITYLKTITTSIFR